MLEVAYLLSFHRPLRRQLPQQRLRLLQIARVVALCKPPVNRSKQFGRLLRLALVTPEACEADGGAEFPGFGLLLAGNRKRPLEIGFGFRSVRLRRLKRNVARNAMNVCLAPSFICDFNYAHRFSDSLPSVLEVTHVRIGIRLI